MYFSNLKSILVTNVRCKLGFPTNWNVVSKSYHEIGAISLKLGLAKVLLYDALRCVFSFILNLVLKAGRISLLFNSPTSWAVSALDASISVFSNLAPNVISVLSLDVKCSLSMNLIFFVLLYSYF